MGLEIATIADEKLRQIAATVDANANNDGKLSRDEYSVFAKEAVSQGSTYEEISKALDMNSFERWWFDVDKVSTDGVDDGNISFGEKAESFGKGLVGGIVKGIVKNPLASAAFIGGSALAVGAGALIAGPVGAAAVGIGLAAVGIGFGIASIVKGIKSNVTSTTDGQTKAGYEEVGTGVALAVLSALGLKSARGKFNAAKDAKAKALTNPAETKIEVTRDSQGGYREAELNADGNPVREVYYNSRHEKTGELCIEYSKEGKFVKQVQQFTSQGSKVTRETYNGGKIVETRVKPEGSKLVYERDVDYTSYTELDKSGNLIYEHVTKRNSTSEKGPTITKTTVKNGKKITTVAETYGYGPNDGRIQSLKVYKDGILKADRTYNYANSKELFADDVIETRHYSSGSKKTIKYKLREIPWELSPEGLTRVPYDYGYGIHY